MFRFIGGLIFSSVFSLAVIGLLDPAVDKETKVDGLVGSLIIYAAPGVVLTTSGHQHWGRAEIRVK